MDISKMKNMVVLKNLPSNIVDEAYVVLKSSKKAKKLEKIENFKNKNKEDETSKNKEYVVKEAELLIEDYINKVEDIDNSLEMNSSFKKHNIKNKKYKRLAYISTILDKYTGRYQSVSKYVMGSNDY